MCQKKNTNKRLLLRHILYFSSNFINSFKGNLSRNCLKHFVFIIKYPLLVTFYTAFGLWVPFFPWDFLN